jgi:hypothetical protein
MTFQIKRRGKLPWVPSRVTSVHRNVPALALPAALDNIQHCYNQNWSCPLNPFENRVKVPVRAGEKIFLGAGHE